MKYLVRLIFVLLLVCFIPAANADDTTVDGPKTRAIEKIINATMVTVYPYKLIIPNNFKEQFPFLSHYPLTAFLFVNKFNERSISQIKVETLKKGSLGVFYDDYDVYKFDKIKGFESMAEELKTLDEFAIETKRIEIITKLQNCYANYKKDYIKFLTGQNGTYRFKMGMFMLRSNENTVMNNALGVEGPIMYCPSVTFAEIYKKDYSFDNKVLKIDTFVPRGIYQGNGWEYFYTAKFRQFCQGSTPRRQDCQFPESFSIPVSIDNAKKIFGPPGKTYCETVFEVIPRNGFMGYNGGSYIDLIQNFDIKKIIKYFYNESTGMVEPALIIEIESTKNKPLHF